MFALVALLWCVYLSDGFVRLPRNAWMFRGGVWKPVRGFSGPDLQLAGGSVDLAWTPLVPWHIGCAVAGNHLDLDTARERLNLVRRDLRWPRIVSGFLFVWVMGVLSALVLADRFLAVMLPWAVIFAGSHVAAFLIFLQRYTRVHAARPPLETWLTLALSPVSLMRAPHAIAAHAAAGLHPVAAAAVLCGDQEFLRIARLWYFDEPALRDTVARIAGARGLGDRLLAAPDGVEAGVSHYCPRCHGTYRGAAARCSDCDGMALESLKAS